MAVTTPDGDAQISRSGSKEDRESFQVSSIRPSEYFCQIFIFWICMKRIANFSTTFSLRNCEKPIEKASQAPSPRAVARFSGLLFGSGRPFGSAELRSSIIAS